MKESRKMISSAVSKDSVGLLWKALMALLALVLIGVVFGLWSNPTHAATTFSVNKVGDASDRKINSVCDSSRKKGNQCTLRAAIQEANATPVANTINFNIGGTNSVKTISSSLPLPMIINPVTINGYSQPGARANTSAQGDNAVLRIQLDGTDSAPSFASGLLIDASNCTIKGLVINRFENEGIQIYSPEASSNRIEGNFIGTNASGTAALGNGYKAVDIPSANNTVGGTTSEARNVISGNNDDGIRLGPYDATGNKVEGNFIGTTANGNKALGNKGFGVDVTSGPNTIGGADSAAGNRIAHNGFGGVAIGHVNGTILYGYGDSILSNQIFQNEGLGIDLFGDGVTANDTGDPDRGANNLQNFPVITSALRNPKSGVTTITGTLNSNPNRGYTIQCFKADGDASGYGEGQVLLDTTSTITNANGDSPTFTCTSSAPAVSDEVSATATNTATGDTSEFAKDVLVSDYTGSNAFSDFSGYQNPSGAWSYGYRTANGQAFTLYSENDAPFESLYRWRRQEAPEPFVAYNAMEDTLSYLTVKHPPYMLNLHPGPEGEKSVVRWTAPSSGTVKIEGRFEGIDADTSVGGTTMDVAVLKTTATTLFSANVNGYGATAPFSITRSVAAGDTIDFSVGYGKNSTYDYDSTGLSVAITPIG